MSFLFENLDVYKKSLTWLETTEEICKRSRGLASNNLLDQFSRASLSISLNIAEGNGRWHKPDKRQFFWIARGSVFECIPVLHVLSKAGVINGTDLAAYRSNLDELARMLTGLIKSVEAIHSEMARPSHRTENSVKSSKS